MSDYLYHHGIKGQKWGVRRFQTRDGGLTTAGKIRYKVKGAVEKAKSNHAAKKEEKARIKQIEAERSKPLKYMTNEELKTHINRLSEEKRAYDLQKQLSSLDQKKVSAGKAFIDSAMKNAIAPALITAGKNVATKMFENTLSDLTGLNKNDLGKLEKTVKELELNKRKREAEKAITLVDDFYEKRKKKST